MFLIAISPLLREDSNMPIIHQQYGFDYGIEPECSEPPYVCLLKDNVVILVTIGIPEKELPHINHSINASHEELDQAFDVVSDNQEKFLNAWKRIHGQPV